MKKILFTICLLASMAHVEAADPIQPGHEIRIHIKGFHDTTLYLANYYADKTYKADSTHMDKNGWAVFKGNKPMPCGIYMTAVGSTKLFEMVICEQFFTIETDTGDYLGRLKIKGSPENELFMKYQKTSGEHGYQAFQIRQKLKEIENIPEKSKEVKTLKDSLAGIEKFEREFADNIVKTQPKSVLGRVLRAIAEVEVPDAPKGSDGKPLDSSFEYKYYRDHYWDNIDLESDCLARSPIFHNKLKRFFTQVIPQEPDTIIKWADYIISRARSSREIFKYSVQWITSNYGNSQFICMDAVPVHMILSYYTFKDCWWVDSAEIIRSRTRAESVFPTLCGKQAPDIQMHDSSLERELVAIVKADTNQYTRWSKMEEAMNRHGVKNLYSVKNDYVVLVFWDPDCGHCKAELPKLKKVYEKYKDKGMEVYAVGVEQDYEKWRNYIKDNDLRWINVIDVYNISEFRKLYDISSTPVIYLLDKTKTILAKRLDANSLEQLMEHELRKKQ